MVGETLQGALEALRAERARLDGAIASLEGLLAATGGGTKGGGRGGRRRAGRPPKASPAAAPAAARAKAGGKRKNAPRGLLKRLMHDALKKSSKPLAPVDLMNAILKAGYPNKNKKTLYASVFTAARKDSAVKHSKEGFALK